MKSSSLSRLDWLSLACIAGTLLLVILMYPRLPEQIPVHWNAAGEIDRYSSRLFGVLMMPGIALATFVLFKVLPPMSPKGFRLDESRSTLDVIQVVLVALACAIGVATVLIAVGVQLDMVKVVLMGLGLMLMVTGNVLNKVRKNFFVGIRTPWTLADDEVWAKTHRFAGRTFFAGGLLVCVLAFFQSSAIPVLAGVSIAVLLPVVYSFFVYRKLHGTSTD